jgi:hypothetical protein
VNHEDRRTRLRLVRRPRTHYPKHIRERERAPEPVLPPAPPGVRRRIKAIDWIKWATVAAAPVASFGLIATALSTYYGALVAKLQLEQSREDSEKEEADQASPLRSGEKAAVSRIALSIPHTCSRAVG